MYLKSIELTGFKSFGKKTILEFHSAISSIVGPNGSGKCVAPNTLIQLADGRRVPIQELFDQANISPRKVRRYDDGVAVLASDDAPEVISLDLQRQRMVRRPIAAFIRRTAPDALLTITTRSGKKITATPYHPLFTLKDGKISALRADEIVEGVRIAAPRRLDIDCEPHRFSMLSVLSAFRQEDKVYLPHVPNMIEHMVGSGTRSAVRIARGTSVSAKVVQRWFDGQSLPVAAALDIFKTSEEREYVRDRTLKSDTTGTMRVPEVLDERMARFLGYLISEGRNCRNGQIRFVNDDMPLVEDFVACARECFDVSTTVKSYKGRGIQDAFISSTTLSRFLDRVLGITQDGHSRSKVVPPQLFNSPHYVIAAFLSSLFEGDAYIHFTKENSRGAYIEYVTASEQLARDVSSLLLRIGVHSSLRRKLKRATNSASPVTRTYWSLFISGSENLQASVSALSFRGRKREALSRLYRNEVHANPNYDLVPNVCGLVREVVQVAGVSIKKARKNYPTLAAYYENRCEASRPGLLRAIRGIEYYGQNLEPARKRITHLRLLAVSDVLWDEVVSVEQKSGAGYVYDLTVVGEHNFVANDVVVHNSNVAEAFRFVLGEQSMKAMRGKRGEDLIWGGSPALPRQNRAGVKVTFDNKKRFLDIDFPEVVVERVVHRDGQNEYLLNGSQVRLKDVIRLLAGANIGGSGYQIISQGQADHILNASPKERREMVEDALGLKLYQHKKAESERKLEETAANIEKTQSLRREIAPHLKFLQSQVEKIEKAREMKDDLAARLGDYLAREDAWITQERARLTEESSAIVREASELEKELKRLRALRGASEGDSGGGELLVELERVQKELSQKRAEREKLVRDLGRAEGALDAVSVTIEHVVPAPHVREFVGEIIRSIEEAETLDDIGRLKQLLWQLRGRIKAFVDGLSGAAPLTNEEVRRDVARLSDALAKIEAEEKTLTARAEALRRDVAQAREASFAAERDEVKIEARARLLAIRTEEEANSREKVRFEEEVREGIALLSSAMPRWQKDAIPEGALSEDRGVQEKRRRDIERLKIKIEESGVGEGGAITKEYTQTKERDEFLARELADLERSAAALEDIIVELEKTIDERFTEGLVQINGVLKEFFTKLFGGGDAKLTVEEPRKVMKERGFDDLEDNVEDELREEEDLYAGLSISVSLPRKKVRGLEVLSGGERALTSIALIFSMSQVNPPPFLILDETDAALDEANSRRYADMVKELSKKSQLVVITHNRATMSAAGELYGVTMDSSGVSKILSVKLEEAERVAK